MHLFNNNTRLPLLKRFLAYSLLILIVCITLLSLISLKGWQFSLELASHFQLQYFLLSFILFVLLALSRKKIPLLIAVFCLSVQLANILPWYLPHSQTNAEIAGHVRILSANINVQNKSYSKVLSLVRKEKPDLAVFMEIDKAWVNQFQTLTDILPYGYEKPNPYNLGIALYSKLPLDNVSFNFFGTPNNPSIVGNLTLNGQVVSIIATHPHAPARLDYFHLRNKQLEEISNYVKALKNPVIVVGDLNITMWSPYYKRFMQKSGLRNAREGFGILPTWPTKPTFSLIPAILSRVLWIPLDHCLVSPGIKVKNIATRQNVDSDHLPLSVELIVPLPKS